MLDPAPLGKPSSRGAPLGASPGTSSRKAPFRARVAQEMVPGSPSASGVTAVLQPPHELTITDSPNKCVALEKRQPHTPFIAPRLTPGAIVVSGWSLRKKRRLFDNPVRRAFRWLKFIGRACAGNNSLNFVRTGRRRHARAPLPVGSIACDRRAGGEGSVGRDGYPLRAAVPSPCPSPTGRGDANLGFGSFEESSDTGAGHQPRKKGAF
jgi:hypothetical protein